MVTALVLPSSQAYAQATTQAPAATQTVPAPNTAATPSAAAKPSTVAKARPHHKKATPVAEVPQAPPPPQTLEQQPPAAPQVSYRNGQLTISAPNSTLSSILRAVQLQTGASVDVPSSAGSERVAMQLGPARPRDVMNTLLHGSKFDYVILGVAGDPGAIQKVILTPKLAAGATSQASNGQQPVASDDSDEGTAVADTGGESEYPGPAPEQPPQPPGAMRRPMGAPGGQQFQQQQSNDQTPMPFAQQNDPNVVKTPEQLMQELQQMQQQQQQYQDQMNPANQNPQ
jgi:hypothetical protein